MINLLHSPVISISRVNIINFGYCFMWLRETDGLDEVSLVQAINQSEWMLQK